MNSRYSDIRPKPRPVTLTLIAGFHLLVLYGLVWALAPNFTQSAHDSVLTAINIADPPNKKKIIEPQAPEPVPDEGAEGAAGRKAVPKELVVPKPKHDLSKKKKKAAENSGDGDDTSAGAANSGQGTGAGGTGSGTGSGNKGRGIGGKCKPSGASVKTDGINQATDFSTPPGGRKTRFWKTVRVTFTVTTNGRARNCSVVSSGVDADATGRVCRLVQQKVRFNPARGRNCEPFDYKYNYILTFKPIR